MNDLTKEIDAIARNEKFTRRNEKGECIGLNAYGHRALRKLLDKAFRDCVIAIEASEVHE